jgi:alpha-beta hydrolase superfamily lysophospholipase
MTWTWAPTMLRTRSGGGPSIAYQVVRAKGDPKVAVLVNHGYGDYAYRYREAVEQWTDRGILVAAYDMRGHGHSEGPRGRIERFTDYVDDVLLLLDTLAKDAEWQKTSPPNLFGHSMGGLVAIHVALTAPDRLSGLALSSPWVGLAFPVPAVKKWAGELMSGALPGFALSTGIKGSDVTRNVELAKLYETDPLVFHTATSRWFTESIAAQAKAMEAAPRIKLPLFCLQAGEDKIASVAETEKFVSRVTSVQKSYRRLPGAYHEILNEPERAGTIREFGDALLGLRSMQHEAKTIIG